jgi:hypothetical protein
MINLFCIKNIYDSYKFYITSLIENSKQKNLIFIDSIDHLLEYIINNNLKHSINILINPISELVLEKLSYIKKYNNNISLLNTSLFNSNNDMLYISKYNIDIIDHGYKLNDKFRNIFNISYPINILDIVNNEKINNIGIINNCKESSIPNISQEYPVLDINSLDFFDKAKEYKILIYLNDTKHTLYNEYILQKCIFNKIIIVSNLNFSNYSEILSKYIISIKIELLENFIKFINANYNYIYNMVYKDFDASKQILNIQNSINIFFEHTIKINDYGFIIIRHVNSERTNNYWIESYKSIRKFYNNKIVIIDDNSNYLYIKYNESDFFNCDFIQSEYNGRGEILGYYYLYINKLFKKAIIIHDSVFINSYIDFNKFNNIKFIWHFTHHWDNEAEELNLLNKIENNDTLRDIYNDKNKWVGCFGVQSIVDYVFLEKIVLKYNLFTLLINITNRSIRMNFERIFALLCFAEDKELINDPSLLGIIHHYIHWGYTYENYLNDKENKSNDRFPIIKVWTGR